MYDSMLLHTAWLLVIPYSAIVAIIIYSVYYRDKAFLLSIKEAYPEIGHYCVGVGDRHSDYSVYYVVPVVPYSVLCSVLYV